ncbi:MAG: glycosyltransferase family 9 protein, partial [Spongiibacteraceae bacterium]
AVVSNDSGLMHIAAAIRRPLVVVYGSTSPGFTPPLAEQVRVLQIPVDCGPCFQRECPLGHLKCLETLYPPMVLQALDELIADPQHLKLN